MEKQDLRELLSDWCDQDIAMYLLACSIGLMEYDEPFDEFRRVKGVFWTNNKYAEMLFAMLREMTKTGILETNEDSQFRWNQSFNEYWLKAEHSGEGQPQ
jgi:hypothetical protein